MHLRGPGQPLTHRGNKFSKYNWSLQSFSVYLTCNCQVARKCNLSNSFKPKATYTSQLLCILPLNQVHSFFITCFHLFVRDFTAIHMFYKTTLSITLLHANITIFNDGAQTHLTSKFACNSWHHIFNFHRVIQLQVNVHNPPNTVRVRHSWFS